MCSIWFEFLHFFQIIQKHFQLGIRLLEQDSYEKVDTLEQLQKQLEDTRSINLRLFEEIREKNDREKIRIKKLEDSHNVSLLLV